MVDDEERWRRRRYIEQVRELNEAAIREAEDNYFPAPEDTLEKYRREQLARQAERTRDQERDWNAWADARIAAVRAAEPFTKLQTDVIGCVISEERARQRAELKAALDELRAELRAELRDAKARGDETVKTLRTEMARVKAYDDGSLIDITPASSVIRKTKDNNAA